MSSRPRATIKTAPNLRAGLVIQSFSSAHQIFCCVCASRCLSRQFACSCTRMWTDGVAMETRDERSVACMLVLTQQLSYCLSSVKSLASSLSSSNTAAADRTRETISFMEQEKRAFMSPHRPDLNHFCLNQQAYQKKLHDWLGWHQNEVKQEVDSRNENATIIQER